MLDVIDISGWQKGMNLTKALQVVDGCIIKATEGLGYVNPYCDGWVQDCKTAGKKWGFYHYGQKNDAVKEADYFYSNCKGYFGYGIPVLDWEENQDVAWVNAFVRRIHELTGIWAWIYANPWRFNQGEVEQNCARWLASYPAKSHPTFADAKGWDCPEADGLTAAWQFCSDGVLADEVYSGTLDCSIFYGSKETWDKYAGCYSEPVEEPEQNKPENTVEVIETDKHKITIEEK